MYLLDTNHCSRIIQGHPALIERLRILDNALIATCVIVMGELVFTAKKSKHYDDNIETIMSFINEIQIFPIDEQAAAIYGDIKSILLKHFGPRDKAVRDKTKVERLGFSESDLWIAAIAKRYGLTIVSADGDFSRMKEAFEIDFDKWWSPELDQSKSD